MKKLLLLWACTLCVTSAYSQIELLTNGGFESGDLTAWTVSSVNAVDAGPTTCTENWRVQSDSVDLCCCVPDIGPSEGVFAAFTSFDSSVAATEWILEQQVSIPSTIVSASFSFDFTGEFDFSLGAPITIPRELRVDIYRMDGTPFSNFWLDSFTGTGALSENYSETIDVSGLLSGLEGMDAMIRITALTPEPGTGPGKTMVDNMSFLVDDGLGVADQTLANTLTVSPNPSNGVFNLNYTGNQQLTKATIYNVSGKQLATYDLSSLQINMELNTNLPTGFYILNIQSKTSQTSKKLIIQ